MLLRWSRSTTKAAWRLSSRWCQTPQPDAPSGVGPSRRPSTAHAALWQRRKSLCATTSPNRGGSSAPHPPNAALPILACLLLCALPTPHHLAAAAPHHPYACDADQAGYSQLSCFGETATMRSCRFRNLYYDTAAANGTTPWAYFEHPDDPPEIKLAGQSSVSFEFRPPPEFTAHPLAADPFFFTPGLFITNPKLPPPLALPGYVISVAQVRGPPPVANATQLQPGLHLMWEFFGNSRYSYGHCMLNDWFPTVLVLASHFPTGIPPYQTLIHGASVPAVCLRYLHPFSRRGPAVRFVDVVANATAAPQRWLRFCDLVLGDGGHQLVSLNQLGQANGIPEAPNPIFSALNWRLFRHAVLLAHGLLHNSSLLVAPVGTAPPLHVTVMSREALPQGQGFAERRRILNAGALAVHLQAEFPRANVTAVNFMALDPLEQLRVMQKTSVFITTQGSASFRHVFLGHGARVIFVGSPLSDLHRNNFGCSAFHEVPTFFQVADYKIIKYPILPTHPEYNTTAFPTQKTEQWEMYNADLTLDMGRMTTYVRAALHEVARGRQWMSDV